MTWFQMTERKRIATILAPAMLAAMVVSLVGCGRGDGLKRVKVHGSVTWQGAPVADGQIRFYPEAGTEGPLSIAKVEGGKYAYDANGGVPAGTHQIRIRAWDPNLPRRQGPTAPERPQLLPAHYNKDSKLTCEIEYQGGWTERNFELE